MATCFCIQGVGAVEKVRDNVDKAMEMTTVGERPVPHWTGKGARRGCK